jgi:N-methylhydantoinase A
MIEGQTVQGPAVVTEDETTIIVPSSRQVTAQPDGTIDMTTKGARA